MNSGIYVHIPYCLQQCPYCDFATVLANHPIGPSEYINLLIEEIQNRHASVPFRKISTIYFGGGTPSLINSRDLNAVIQSLKSCGFDMTALLEVTLEINPGTITEQSLEELLSIGFNRFSVGAQTFQEERLKELGREHSVSQTKATLALLHKHNLNFSIDLLFAHANQTEDGLKQDLDVALSYEPPHISAYCLTLPDKHPLQVNRPNEDLQANMIESVRHTLNEAGLMQYEISNFSKPGFESKNNQIYWGGYGYWGIGMSAHSYFPIHPPSLPWGARLWNPPTIEAYRKQVRLGEIVLPTGLPESRYEILQEHQALTDFCHVRLRTRRGLDERDLRAQFSQHVCRIAIKRLSALKSAGYVDHDGSIWTVVDTMQVLSEQVFLEMTFLKEDLV